MKTDADIRGALRRYQQNPNEMLQEMASMPHEELVIFTMQLLNLCNAENVFVSRLVQQQQQAEEEYPVIQQHHKHGGGGVGAPGAHRFINQRHDDDRGSPLFTGSGRANAQYQQTNYNGGNFYSSNSNSSAATSTMSADYLSKFQPMEGLCEVSGVGNLTLRQQQHTSATTSPRHNIHNNNHGRYSSGQSPRAVGGVNGHPVLSVSPTSPFNNGGGVLRSGGATPNAHGQTQIICSDDESTMALLSYIKGRGDAWGED